jgi:protein-S-isoprenylcysteine O-methyltransferase Ste14
MTTRLYWLFSYLGLMTFSGAFLMGFRHDPAAPGSNVVFNILLFVAFFAVHIVMTMPAFKKALFGSPTGTPSERRIYVALAIITWVAVWALHRPVAGPAFDAPVWLQYLGTCAVLLSVVAFFEFATFEGLGSLVGLPGSDLSHSAGSETPLLTEGPYAQVRHPMYRAACFICFSSLLLHPNPCQLLFAVMASLAFLAFIPFEERNLLRARGEEYRAYMEQTRYRAFPGIW